MRTRLLAASVAVLSLAAAGSALAGDGPDISKLYSVATQATPSAVPAGGKGTVEIRFHTEPAAHISDEAPLKIVLTGKNLQVAKQTLRYQDSVAKKTADKAYPDPRFEIPFTAQARGEGSVDAKMTFFVCSADLCSRQQKTVTIPVTVK
jgi:hypothetical protein